MMIRKFGDEVCRDLVKYSYVLFEKYIYVYLFLLFYHSIFECISLCFSVNILNYCNSICDKRSRSLYKLYQLYQLRGTYLIRKILYRKFHDRDESCLIEGKCYSIDWQTSNARNVKVENQVELVDLDLEFNYF